MNRNLLILYGTQTGMAKEVAEDLGREATRRYFQVKVVDLQDFPVTTLPEQLLVIFVCSTTGQGEVPDNMKAFWKFLLRKNLPSNSLQQLSYAVFGLGDSGYVKYNYVSKMLFNRLKQLGGTPLIRRGDGNDQHKQGLYGELFTWGEELWEKLIQLYPFPPGAQILPRDVPIVFSDTNIDVDPSNHFVLSTGQDTPFLIATLAENKRLTDPEWEQDVRHITLQTDPKDNISYVPGDVAYLQPRNPTDKVLSFLEMMKLDPNQTILSFTPTDPTDRPLPFRVPITVQQLFTHCLDLMGTPRRYFFELLSFFCTEKREKDQLLFFSSAAGYQELYDYNHKPKRTYIDIFMDFLSAKPSLEYLIDLIGLLKPRPFSISSSHKAFPGKIHISMVVVKYISKIKRIKHGICSTWLANLTPNQGDKVPYFIRSGTIRFPEDTKIPLMMVGPGTGCAIFRAMLQERGTLTTDLGTTLFFFGCRKEGSDYLYKDEWQSLQEKKALTHFSVAFSRDQPQKVYVTHKIREHKDLIWDIIVNQNGRIYVSGKAEKMPTDIRKELIKILEEKESMTAEEAEQFLKGMEFQNRYMMETWA